MGILYHHLKAFVLEQTATVTWGTISIACVLVAFQLHTYRKHQKFVENYGAEPTYRPLLDPLSAPSMVFGPGLDFFWEKRSTCKSLSRVRSAPMLSPCSVPKRW